jgi:hypothetical protein
MANHEPELLYFFLFIPAYNPTDGLEASTELKPNVLVEAQRLIQG